MKLPTSPPGASTASSAMSLVFAVVPVVAAAALGNMATLPNIPGWYANLEKPWFNPPNSVFGPVWTILYGLMACAFYRVLRSPSRGSSRFWPVMAFLFQLALNAGWSFAFFGARSPLLGLAVIAPLWGSIVWTLRLFWKVDRLAGACLAPYLAWVSFAVVLNLAIFRLND